MLNFRDFQIRNIQKTIFKTSYQSRNRMQKFKNENENKFYLNAGCQYYQCVKQGSIYNSQYKEFDMNLNKESSINDFDKVDAEVGMRRNESAPEISRNPTVNSIQEQYLEVVEKKQQVFGDQADFLRLLNQVKKNDPFSNIQSFKKNDLKKKQSQKKQEELKAAKVQESKRQKLMKIIQPNLKNFKALNNPSPTDNEVSRFRAEARQKIFKFLLYGIQELRLLNPNDLSDEQKRVADLKMKDPYLLAKSITTEIDIEFFKNLNQQNKQTISRRYKTFLKTFTTNIAEQSNIFLRKKVLTRQFKGKILVTMNEQQFYPPHIRQKLIQKQNLLLREAAAQQKPTIVNNEENQYVPQQPVQPPVVQKKQEEKKPKYKYLDQYSLGMIRDLLKPEQVRKMRNLLQFDNRKDIQAKLVENINKVFENVI